MSALLDSSHWSAIGRALKLPRRELHISQCVVDGDSEASIADRLAGPQAGAPTGSIAVGDGGNQSWRANRGSPLKVLTGAMESSMKAGLLLVLAAVTARELPAQTGLVSLVGAVRDSAGSPIAGAEVRLESGRPPVFTDSSGGFWIDSLSPGRWVLRLRKPGFEPMTVDFTVPEGAEGDVELEDVVFRPAPPRVITLAGTVRDAITGRPIDGVHIRVGGDTRGFSDASGHFLQRVVVRGDALVDLARVGFRSLHVDLWPGDKQDTVKLAISMRPVAVELSEVVVEGASGSVAQAPDFERHRKAGFGTFLTAERIQRIASISAVDMLRWAGVQVNGEMFADQGRFLRIAGVPYACGARGLGPVILIDGRRWPTESAMAYLEATDPNEIVGVEVYGHGSSVPPEYNGPDAECGVVAIWYRHE